MQTGGSKSLIGAFLLAFTSMPALAAPPVFRCKGPDGGVSYQNTQCSTAAESEELFGEPKKATWSEQLTREKEASRLRQQQSRERNLVAGEHKRQREQIALDERDRRLAERKIASIAPVSFQWATPLHRSPRFAIDHQCVVTISYDEDEHMAPCGTSWAFLGDVEISGGDVPILACRGLAECVVWLYCKEQPPRPPVERREAVTSRKVLTGVWPKAPTDGLWGALKDCAEFAPPPAFTERLRAAGGQHPID